VHPREVFAPAVREGSAAIVVAHNHPSGDPAPSADDIRVTKQLVESGKIMDIKVLDHVVVCRDGRYESLRESGQVNF
jgi:DNA repair protein RadC